MSVELADTRAHPMDEKLREANHRISNHLALVVSMVRMQASAVAKGPASISRDEARALLEEAAGKITTVGQLHRWLAETPQEGEVRLDDYLIKSCASLIHALGFGARVTIAQKLGGGCIVSPEQAQQVGLIVSEILMNAAKHAHPTGMQAQMLIDCHRTAAGRIEITISDDGIGLPEGFDNETGGGVGFRLIRALARSLDAELAIESDSLGLSFRILLPARGADVAVAAR